MNGSGWALKMLATAFVGGIIAWGSLVTRSVIAQDVRIDTLEKQYVRIEQKLDLILYRIGPFTNDTGVAPR